MTTVMLKERSDLPLAVPAGSAPVVALAALPAHPSNTVLVQVRRGGGSAQTIRAVAGTAPAGEQWFSAALPTVEEGSRVEYRAELVRAGQRLALFPADGGWLTVTGGPAPVPAAVLTRTHGPVWDHQLSYFATFDAHGRVQPIGETPEGYRIDFVIEGGTVRGSGVEAEILPCGGDWLCIRRDGVAVLDIRATYRVEDGALVYYRAQGLLDLGPDGYARAVAGLLSGRPSCSVTPTFHTPGPSWQWLNRCQGFGVGRVLLDEARVCYDVYLPRVGERL